MRLPGGCEERPCSGVVPAQPRVPLPVLADSGSTCVQGVGSGGASVSLSVKWGLLGGTEMTSVESGA